MGALLRGCQAIARRKPTKRLPAWQWNLACETLRRLRKSLRVFACRIEQDLAPLWTGDKHAWEMAAVRVEEQLVTGKVTTVGASLDDGETRALALLVKHPAWTDRQIAEAVGEAVERSA